MTWILLVVVLATASLIWLGWNLTLDALWQPTDRVTVRRILLLGEVDCDDHVVDLGCGDGRIVVSAARDFGARSTGVEIDPFRVLWGRAWIFSAGLRTRARIVHGNMYTYALSDATVVILFLSATSNFRLQDRMRKELAPGSRVVSYYHPIWGWEPDLIGEAKDGYPIYVYRMGEAT